ncbi:hypothetical protein L6452_04944, partial [Arctium lappa]
GVKEAKDKTRRVVKNLFISQNHNKNHKNTNHNSQPLAGCLLGGFQSPFFQNYKFSFIFSTFEQYPLSLSLL